jgi:hypothetical protein
MSFWGWCDVFLLNLNKSIQMEKALEILNKKLKNASPEVLNRVLGYVDSIIETDKIPIVRLTENQQKILDAQLNLPPEDYMDSGKMVADLKEKYGL